MPSRRVPSGLPPPLASAGRTVVMAVLNVTPDSFSDGGRFLDVERAFERGMHQVRLGADLIDVGGESTRPGAQRIPLAEELNRVLPVIEQLVAEGVSVSIDTMRAKVAEAAVAAGAVLVNDVSGGLADDAMLPLLAESGVPAVLMHWRGHSTDMSQRATYPSGVVAEVADELKSRLNAAVAAGVAADRVVLDPGLGFAKEPEHNWALLQSLHALEDLGQPLLIGASRKRFLGALLGDEAGPRPVDARDDATLAVTALSAAAGVWCVRVHDARGNVDAVRVAEAWKAGCG